MTHQEQWEEFDKIKTYTVMTGKGDLHTVVAVNKVKKFISSEKEKWAREMLELVGKDIFIAEGTVEGVRNIARVSIALGTNEERSRLRSLLQDKIKKIGKN